jgi:glyoxylase-like metal-dependent hydrolase (beta-lactamase superfamily II)
MIARAAALFAALLLVSCAEHPLKLQEVASHVFAFIGETEEIKPSNRGNVINTGFIVGSDGVVVIDSGANHKHGQMILDEIASVTSKPIVLLINTHPHPENVLGNSAFAEKGIPILAHSETTAAMQARCETCLKHTREQLSEEIMRGTEIVIPTRSVEHSQDLSIAGRRLRLLYFGWAHTEGDLGVLDVETGVLFAGGLVFHDQIPVMQQANTRGWIAALDALKNQPITRIVPAAGPIANASAVADTLVYLKSLLESMERQYAEGKSAIDVLSSSDLPQFREWALYDWTHQLNVQHVYRELEREELSAERDELYSGLSAPLAPADPWCAAFASSGFGPAVTLTAGLSAIPNSDIVDSTAARCGSGTDSCQWLR